MSEETSTTVTWRCPHADRATIECAYQRTLRLVACGPCLLDLVSGITHGLATADAR